MSSGDSDETGSEDESIKFDTIQRAGRRRTMVEKEEAKVEKKVEDKVGEKKETEKVVEKQEENEKEKKQDGVVEKLLDEMVSKSMEEKSSVKEDEKENAGVVERVVEQLVSDTVDGSSPAQCLDAKEEVKTSLVLKVEEKLSNSDSTKLNNEKSEITANHIHGHDNAARDGSDTAKEVEVVAVTTPVRVKISRIEESQTQGRSGGSEKKVIRKKEKETDHRPDQRRIYDL